MAHERIEINPEIMGGKPVIRGTRVPVELLRANSEPVSVRSKSLPIIRGLSLMTFGDSGLCGGLSRG